MFQNPTLEFLQSVGGCLWVEGIYLQLVGHLGLGHLVGLALLH